MLTQTYDIIIWTGEALVESATNDTEAERERDFDWVKTTCDETGDNIYIWDFRNLETGGGLYFLPENAASTSDSHPNATIDASIAPLIGQHSLIS